MKKVRDAKKVYELHQALTRLGADGFLRKPFDVRNLVQHLERLLGV